IAALALAAPLGALAADATSTNSPAAPSAPPASPKSRGIPFRGKLASVDKVAKTITLEGPTKRTFEITSQTRIIKNGKPATLDNATVGGSVSGSNVKTPDGKLSARMTRFGANPEPAAQPAPTAPASPTSPK